MVKWLDGYVEFPNQTFNISFTRRKSMNDNTLPYISRFHGIDESVVFLINDFFYNFVLSLTLINLVWFFIN